MNEFELPPSEPLWLKMAKQVYEQPLILMLLASSVVSALFGSYDDAICVLVAVGIVLTGTSPHSARRWLIYSRVCAGTTIRKITGGSEQACTTLLPPNPVRNVSTLSPGADTQKRPIPLPSRKRPPTRRSGNFLSRRSYTSRYPLNHLGSTRN